MQTPTLIRRLLLFALLVSTGFLGWRLWRVSGGHGRAAEPVPPAGSTPTPRGDLTAHEQATIHLFRDAAPSVVYITTLEMHRDAFTFDIQRIPKGTGSGFLWDDKGNVVTNFHVIRGAQAATVTLADQSTWKARLVGVAADKDLAVLRIEAPARLLKAIPVGTSGDLQVGQSVYAIGNPFGFDHTLTTGVISGLGREIQSVTGRPIQGVIQTDAAINPGNSGGPLLDSAGRLVAVNTAIYSPSGAYAGIGFAVPVDTIRRIVPQLIEHGRVIRPGIGVQILDDAAARRAGIRGVLIVGLQPDGSAAGAGLRATRRDRMGRLVLGDIIVAVGEDEIADSNDLYRALDHFTVGDQVRVTVQREGARFQVKLALQALPD